VLVIQMSDRHLLQWMYHYMDKWGRYITVYQKQCCAVLNPPDIIIIIIQVLSI